MTKEKKFYGVAIFLRWLVFQHVFVTMLINRFSTRHIFHNAMFKYIFIDILFIWYLPLIALGGYVKMTLDKSALFLDVSCLETFFKPTFSINWNSI